MKKIIILALFSILLVSCGQNEIEIKNTEVKTSNAKKINNTDKSVDINKDEKSLTFSDLEKNISKLKDVNLENIELKMLNEEIVSLFNNFIQNKAIKNNDEKICEQLDKNNIDDCKKSVFIKSEKIEKCNIFSNTGSINECKNEMNKNLAEKNLDETICEKIIDNSEEKFEINNCKNKILIDKAVKNLDSKVCNKINDNGEKDMCIEMVKMEKENKKN